MSKSNKLLYILKINQTGHNEYTLNIHQIGHNESSLFFFLSLQSAEKRNIRSPELNAFTTYDANIHYILKTSFGSNGRRLI